MPIRPGHPTAIGSRSCKQRAGARSRCSSGEIYISDPDGSNLRRLTESKADDTSPAWSPDGREIIFSSDRSNLENHDVELYVVPAEGGEPRRITQNKVWDLAPDWRRAPAASRSDKQMAREPVFDAWRGFRTRSGGIHCGFVCFRATDGFFARMVGKDLSTDDPLRIVTGTDPSLPGYESAEVTEIAPGDDWSSSDAQMVRCSVREAAIMCRHASGHGFFLDQDGHKTF